MTRRTRIARIAVIAGALALLVASPAAAATPAKRTVYGLRAFTIPAGQACSFDVAGQPSRGFSTTTDLPDGRELGSFRAHGAYVNAETGASYPTADNFRYVNRIDPATGDLVAVIDGEVADSFLTGDQGPFGLVTNPDGAFYHFVGRVTFTMNPDTYQVLSFAYAGTVDDICAALS